MAGPKEPSSLPVKKAKAAKPATATKPPLSSEFVVDSDDCGDAKPTRVEKPASKTAKRDPSSAKSAAPRVLISHAKPSKKRESPSPSPARDDSSGSGSENDSDSQAEKRPSKKRVLAAQNGSPTPNPKPATARPVLVKPSIKAYNNVKPSDQEMVRGFGATRSKSKGEAEESSEGSSSGSESGSENESESRSSEETSIQSPRNQSPVRKSVPRQPTPTYEPPDGFESTSISLHPASKISEILAPSNLHGKQIWHITAPETIPISLVKEVSTQNIGNGASVLEYHGAKYGLVPESEAEQASSRALLLPSAQRNHYRPSNTSIIKTLHLQQIVSLPSHALEKAVYPNRSTSASESYRKTPRQQPEGLKMRYRPFGVSDDSDLETSFEPMPKAPEFRIPASVKESAPARKRKRTESNNDSSNIGSAVKSKKRKQSSQATAGATEDPIDIDAISDTRSNEIASPAKSSRLGINGIGSNGSETKEQQRKRKEKDKPDGQQAKPATALPLDVKKDAETIQPGEVVESVPAVANAVEGTSTTNDISPHRDSSDKKAKRDERRRRKEMESASRGASLISADDISQRDVVDSQDQMMQEIETAQREASIQVSAPGDGSPQKQSQRSRESQLSTMVSSQASHRTETKEERAKRKEEKRRRKTESRSA
ncbi:hypothetical protein IMSHALPRED_006250 [Imshaugia aleurites]|uniref:Uncharacterized protein n=1 Tax=Imshaugia aleurites TaxID=172621 RepID=A0A8H3FJN1_9LECA|nr:hypothetical protein IMSHALPRED_006250 [Imshaugia aleurites]